MLLAIVLTVPDGGPGSWHGGFSRLPVRESLFRSAASFEQEALALVGTWVRRSKAYSFYSAAGHLAFRTQSVILDVPKKAWRRSRYEVQKGVFFLTLLHRLLIRHEVPVASGDINETFLAFTHAMGENTFYTGCGAAIRETLREGPLYLLTGDSISEVEDKFLPDLESQENVHLSAVELAGLQVLPLAGQDRYRFDLEQGRWVGESLFAGITDAELVRVRGVLDEIKAEFQVEQTFSDYENRGLVEVRQALSGFFVAFKPAGKVPAEKRKEFRRRYESLLFEMALSTNERLSRRGLGHLRATKAGSTTIDIRTADKGKALAKIQMEEVKPWNYIVYLGDNLSKGGGDERAMEAASLGIHVGPITPQAQALQRDLRPTGRKLILSIYTASEGATAEYLHLINLIRRLARRLHGVPAQNPPAIPGIGSYSTLDELPRSSQNQIRLRRAA